MPYRPRMVWPVRCCQASKVSINSGAEPQMNRRIRLVACRSSPGSASRGASKVGTATETGGGGRERGKHGPRVEPGQPDHLAGVDQRAMDGHEQAVHMKDRQRVEQHVAGPKAP